MKKYSTCKYYLLLLLFSVTLCACSRSALPVESYQAAESEFSTKSQAEKSGQAGIKDAKKVQADFDEFTMEVFRKELIASPLSLNCLVRHPENYGIVATDMTLGEFSDTSLKEATQEVKDTKQKLETFDPSLLTSDQLLTYKMFMDYLDTALSSDGLELYTQALSPVIGTQAQLPIIFAEYTFSEKKDVENYLALLSTIDEYYKELAAFEKVRADAGLGQSDDALDSIIRSCKDYMIRPESSFLTETFDSKLIDVPDLTEDERNAFKAQHSTILKEHFIPAYQNLASELEQLKGKGVNNNGLYYFKDGKRYYEYLVSSLSGTTSTIPELKKRINKELGKNMAEISLLAQNNPEVMEQFSTITFSQTEPVNILESLKTQCLNDFPALSESTFTVKSVPKALESSLSPAFFLTPPIDSYEKGTIYINGMNEQSGQSLYPTLAHEGYPGHLYQSLYQAQKESCPLRRLLSCDGYSEGWGTYSELYSYSFDNGLSDPFKKLMVYNQSSVLALYAILDINIHYEGWDLAKTSAFLSEFYDITDESVSKEIFNSIVENPCNYLKYYTGYLEILDMRTAAEETLGTRYSPKAFHTFILDMESASFRVIEPYFRTWLLTYDLKP